MAEEPAVRVGPADLANAFWKGRVLPSLWYPFQRSALLSRVNPQKYGHSGFRMFKVVGPSTWFRGYLVSMGLQTVRVVLTVMLSSALGSLGGLIAYVIEIPLMVKETRATLRREDDEANEEKRDESAGKMDENGTQKPVSFKNPTKTLPKVAFWGKYKQATRGWLALVPNGLWDVFVSVFLLPSIFPQVDYETPVWYQFLQIGVYKALKMVSYPFLVASARRMDDPEGVKYPNSTIHTLKQIKEEEGWKGLYSGWLVSFLV